MLGIWCCLWMCVFWLDGIGYLWLKWVCMILMVLIFGFCCDGFVVLFCCVLVMFVVWWCVCFCVCCCLLWFVCCCLLFSGGLCLFLLCVLCLLDVGWGFLLVFCVLIWRLGCYSWRLWFFFCWYWLWVCLWCWWFFFICWWKCRNYDFGNFWRFVWCWFWFWVIVFYCVGGCGLLGNCVCFGVRCIVVCGLWRWWLVECVSWYCGVRLWWIGFVWFWCRLCWGDCGCLVLYCIVNSWLVFVWLDVLVCVCLCLRVVSSLGWVCWSWVDSGFGFWNIWDSLVGLGCVWGVRWLVWVGWCVWWVWCWWGRFFWGGNIVGFLVYVLEYWWIVGCGFYFYFWMI